VVGSLRAGGQERVAANMANHWARRGREVSIVTIYQRGREIAFELHPSVRVHDVGWSRRPREDELDPDTMHAVARAMDLPRATEETLLADVVLVALLRRTIIETRPDAVISLGDSTNVRMLLATDGLRARRVVSEHCDPRLVNIREWDVLRRRFYPRADGIVTLTADAADVIGFDCTVIPSFVAPHPPLGHPLPEGDACVRRVITVARLEAVKRIDLLVEAFNRISVRHPEWQLDIVGDGPERRRLEALGGDRVFFHGATRDVTRALANAHVFAMTSATEGFPNALCEAMASGVPPVVIDCGAGVRDIVRDGIDGILVRGHSIRGFADALDNMLSNDVVRLELARRAPEIVERFGEKRIMAQWEKLLGWN